MEAAGHSAGAGEHSGAQSDSSAGGGAAAAASQGQAGTKGAFSIQSIIEGARSTGGFRRTSSSSSSSSCSNHCNTATVLKPEVVGGDLGDDKKRARTIFSTEQLQQMEAQFMKQQYIVGQQRTLLAEQLGLSETQVKVWFQNRRIKWRKQSLQSQQTHLSAFSAEPNNPPCSPYSMSGGGESSQNPHHHSHHHRGLLAFPKEATATSNPQHQVDMTK